MRRRRVVSPVSAAVAMLVVLAVAWLQWRREPAPASPPALPAPASAPATAAVPDAPVEAVRYDLGRDEARGGHTLARHVGWSDDQLRARLRREPDISAASTYTDRLTAERVVAAALARDKRRVETWFARVGSRPNLGIEYRGARGDVIGRTVRRGRTEAEPCVDAVIVLRWHREGGFIVLTSYPEGSR